MGDLSIDAFFGTGNGPPPKLRKIEAPNNFRPKPVKQETNDFRRDEEAGTSYAKNHQKKEENRLLTQAMNTAPSKNDIIKFEDSDNEGETFTREDPELPELTVFDRYDFNLTARNLPILSKREEILELIKSKSIVVLTATTGTGKSSQVPQYILEEAASEKRNCNIIVTQPRRIAGKS